jgi:hypothetical protein
MKHEPFHEFYKAFGQGVGAFGAGLAACGW